MNSRKCEICNNNIHRAFFLKHLKSKKHLENEKQIEKILPEGLFQEPLEYKPKKIHYPKPLKQIARDVIKIDDKQLNKDLT